MKMLIDFLPIVIFFIVYKLTDDLILATAVLIPATMLQMAYTWFTTKKVAWGQESSWPPLMPVWQWESLRKLHLNQTTNFWTLCYSGKDL